MEGYVPPCNRPDQLAGEREMLIIGTAAPAFDLPGMCKGNVGRYRLKDYTQGWLIVFFYPADFSFICPTEVTGFQKSYSVFASSGCEVLGVSVDPLETHRAWAEELGGIDYPLLSDQDRGMCRAYGVLDEREGRALRATFVIGFDAVIQYALVSHRLRRRPSSRPVRKRCSDWGT